MLTDAVNDLQVERLFSLGSFFAKPIGLFKSVSYFVMKVNLLFEYANVVILNLLLDI